MNAAQTFPSGSNHWPQAHALNWLSMAGPELHIEQNMVPIILNEKEESLNTLQNYGDKYCTFLGKWNVI